MPQIAVTADLHYNPRRGEGHAATHDLLQNLRDEPPEILILAGDIGAGEEFERCLSLFADLPSQRLLVPGNHDIWVGADDPRGNSFTVYEKVLPEICKNYGFHYLDHAPYLCPDLGIGFAGTMNWYDGSWSRDRLRDFTPDWRERLEGKRFRRGMHNDANFVRWPFTDRTICERIVPRFEGHLHQIFAAGLNAFAIAHHPPVSELMYPVHEPLGLDELLWQAFSGNADMEAVVKSNSERIPFAFCGHTHFAREAKLGNTQAINIGGDYHFKRMIRVDWPSGRIRALTFGNAEQPIPRRLQSPKGYHQTSPAQPVSSSGR